eukprot:NODE_216_length_12483_cov_2.137516.p1 type:complete len:722 gc:universal NODE_216_length_12483_cov_2.137516:6811-4646(-)
MPKEPNLFNREHENNLPTAAIIKPEMSSNRIYRKRFDHLIQSLENGNERTKETNDKFDHTAYADSFRLHKCDELLLYCCGKLRKFWRDYKIIYFEKEKHPEPQKNIQIKKLLYKSNYYPATGHGELSKDNYIQIMRFFSLLICQNIGGVVVIPLDSTFEITYDLPQKEGATRRLVDFLIYMFKQIEYEKNKGLYNYGFTKNEVFPYMDFFMEEIAISNDIVNILKCYKTEGEDKCSFVLNLNLANVQLDVAVDMDVDSDASSDEEDESKGSEIGFPSDPVSKLLYLQKNKILNFHTLTCKTPEGLNQFTKFYKNLLQFNDLAFSQINVSSKSEPYLKTRNSENLEAFHYLKNIGDGVFLDDLSRCNNQVTFSNDFDMSLDKYSKAIFKCLLLESEAMTSLRKQLKHLTYFPGKIQAKIELVLRSEGESKDPIYLGYHVRRVGNPGLFKNGQFKYKQIEKLSSVPTIRFIKNSIEKEVILLFYGRDNFKSRDLKIQVLLSKKLDDGGFVPVKFEIFMRDWTECAFRFNLENQEVPHLSYFVKIASDRKEPIDHFDKAFYEQFVNSIYYFSTSEMNEVSFVQSELFKVSKIERIVNRTLKLREVMDTSAEYDLELRDTKEMKLCKNSSFNGYPSLECLSKLQARHIPFSPQKAILSVLSEQEHNYKLTINLVLNDSARLLTDIPGTSQSQFSDLDDWIRPKVLEKRISNACVQLMSAMINFIK